MKLENIKKETQVQSILFQIRKLDHQTRIQLMEEIINLLKDKKEGNEKEAISLTDLNELGSEIWKGVDIDQYVEGERQWD